MGLSTRSHAKPAASKACVVLVGGEQRHLVPVDEMLDTVRRRDEMMHLEERLRPVPRRLGHVRATAMSSRVVESADTEPGSIQASGRTHPSTTRTPPGVKWRDMCSTARVEFVGVGEVADGAEQADDSVEGPVEPERAHVGLHERNVGERLARDGEHRRVEIEPDDLVPVDEVAEVATGTARDVEERRGPRVALLDLRADVGSFGGVVLARGLVDEVVDVGRLAEHGPDSRGAATSAASDFSRSRHELGSWK